MSNPSIKTMKSPSGQSQGQSKKEATSYTLSETGV